MNAAHKRDDSLSAKEQELIAKHHQHRKKVKACLSCHEGVEVSCPCCSNNVLPQKLTEHKVFKTHCYGVGVTAIAVKCPRCKKGKRKTGIKSA